MYVTVEAATHDYPGARNMRLAGNHVDRLPAVVPGKTLKRSGLALRCYWAWTEAHDFVRPLRGTWAEARFPAVFREGDRHGECLCIALFHQFLRVRDAFSRRRKNEQGVSLSRRISLGHNEQEDAHTRPQ